MITAASLREYTRRDLAEMAKEQEILGWHSMRKDDLVRALVKVERARARKAKRKSARSQTGKPAARSGRKAESVASKQRNATPRAKVESNGTKDRVKSTVKSTVKSRGKSVSTSATEPRPAKSSVSLERIRLANKERGRLRDLSSASAQLSAKSRNGKHKGTETKRRRRRDRAVLMVRDSYWLHISWEIGRKSVERAQATMAEHWHTCKPMLRLIEVDSGATTSTAERVEREIEIHGGVNNWYIDVHDPPKKYRVAIGYLTSDGQFHALVRSNAVTTPRPGSGGTLDENWTDVARDYETVFALSGGYSKEATSGDLRDLFEERLRRPMGVPLVARFAFSGGVGRKSDFALDVDAELIIFGQTRPDAQVTLAGEPVKLRADGTFTVRRGLTDRRQVLPIVAESGDGLEQRTSILAVERNMKVMEPVTRDSAVV